MLIGKPKARKKRTRYIIAHTKRGKTLFLVVMLLISSKIANKLYKPC